MMLSKMSRGGVSLFGGIFSETDDTDCDLLFVKLLSVFVKINSLLLHCWSRTSTSIQLRYLNEEALTMQILIYKINELSLLWRRRKDAIIIAYQKYLSSIENATYCCVIWNKIIYVVFLQGNHTISWKLFFQDTRNHRGKSPEKEKSCERCINRFVRKVQLIAFIVFFSLTINFVIIIPYKDSWTWYDAQSPLL